MYIFNLSLATGIYVYDWKHARVTLIFEFGDKGQCANYRPISILPAVSKVLAKEVFRQVYDYLTENCMLSKFQSGFRPKHSKVTALIQMCDEWLENMDDGKLNGVILLDIKKSIWFNNEETFWYLEHRTAVVRRICQIESSNAVLMNNYHPRKQSPAECLKAQSRVHCCSYYILMTCLTV